MYKVYVDERVRDAFIMLGADEAGWPQDSLGNYVMTVPWDIYEALMKNIKDGEDVNETILRLLKMNGNLN